jgi:hypothetical protein
VIAAADPNAPGRLIICSMVETAPGRYATEAYLSTDGGIGWSRTMLEDVALNSFDPHCAFDGNGAAWFLSIGFPGDEPRTMTRLFYYCIPCFAVKAPGTSCRVPAVVCEAPDVKGDQVLRSLATPGFATPSSGVPAFSFLSLGEGGAGGSSPSSSGEPMASTAIWTTLMCARGAVRQPYHGILRVLKSSQGGAS